MRVLLIGYSRIGRRRVIPAFRGLGISQIAVASRSASALIIDSDIPLFGDYESALAGSGADLAYVSLANGEHVKWVEEALTAGMHVVVDKPAFLNLADAQRIVELARERKRVIAEATVFECHPQIEAARRAFADAGVAPLRVVAGFSFPPLDSGDFRYRRDQGGGCLYDVGPYAVATSRIFFRRPPERVACEVLQRHPKTGVDVAFSVLFSYSEGGSLVGHFGFDTEYHNRLTLLGSGLSVEIDRPFTMPGDLMGQLTIRSQNKVSSTEVPPADSFAIFLREVMNAVHGGKNRFADDLIADAQLLAELRKTSGA